MQREHLRALAERLLRYEAVATTRRSETAGFRVCEKLRQLLSTLLGTAGFQALLARALHLATAKVPELSALQVKTDGSLAGLSTVGPVGPHSHSTQMAKGEVMLITELLALLDTFIGEALMLRLTQDVWPQASVDALEEEARGE